MAAQDAKNRISPDERLARNTVVDPPKAVLERRARGLAKEAEAFGSEQAKQLDALDARDRRFRQERERRLEAEELRLQRHEAAGQKRLARIEDRARRHSEEQQRREENLAIDAAVYRDWQEAETARLAAELERRHLEQERLAERERAYEEKKAAHTRAAHKLHRIEQRTRAKRSRQRSIARQERQQRTQERQRAARAAMREALDMQETPNIVERFLIFCYKNIYLIGAYFQRDAKSGARRLRRVCRRLYARASAQWEKSWAIFRAKFNRAVKTVLFPYKTIARATRLLNEELRPGNENGRERVSFWRALGNYFSAIHISLNHIFNTFLPFVGVAVLVMCINFFSDMQFALSVEYCGSNLGCIESESVFYSAQNAMMDRLINEEYIAPEDIVPAFKLTMVEKSKIIDEQTLSDKLVAASGNDIASADGVYIDDEFYGAIENGDEFLIYLDNILDGYRSGEENEVVQFVKNISVRRGIYPSSSVMQLYQLKNVIDHSASVHSQTYTVQTGDTLYGIAVDHDTTVARLRELNDMDEGDSIYGGQKLIVETDGAASGLGIQVTRRETYQEDVQFSVTYVDNERYPAGYTETISNGVYGKQWVTADVTYIDGEIINVNKLSTTPISDPVAKRMLRGTMPVYSSGTDNVDGFIWPVANGAGRFNGSLGSYSGHTGMDIAAPLGLEVLASRGGYVEYATNYSIWPYGRQVYIKHPDGTATRYAHMSVVTVKTGQSVSQGTVIGKVGSSGNSTGTHLHFEIWVGNRYMAPEKYIGYHG